VRSRGNRITRPRAAFGRLWIYLGDCDHPFIVYDYTPDRSAEGPELMLADFRAGYLQSDAYAAYDQIHARGILEVGCMAHARRKFDTAKTSDQERAHAGLAWIGLLYQIERTAVIGRFKTSHSWAPQNQPPLWSC
jgi:hypothetical protein